MSAVRRRETQKKNLALNEEKKVFCNLLPRCKFVFFLFLKCAAIFPPTYIRFSEREREREREERERKRKKKLWEGGGGGIEETEMHISNSCMVVFLVNTRFPFRPHQKLQIWPQEWRRRRFFFLGPQTNEIFFHFYCACINGTRRRKGGEEEGNCNHPSTDLMWDKNAWLKNFFFAFGPTCKKMHLFLNKKVLFL